MPRSPSPRDASAKLLPLLLALPEEAQCALLALLRWQQTAGVEVLPIEGAPPLPSAPGTKPNESSLTVTVVPASVVEGLSLRVEILEQELQDLRQKVAYTGPSLLTKKAFLRQHPDLYSKSGLDKVLFLRHENGLSQFKAVSQRAKGCRVLIDPKSFLEWYRWYHARG